jgi:hypothetical protein
VSTTREEVLNAILASVQAMVFSTPIAGQTTWLTTGRRLRLWSDVPGDSQPAAYVVEHEEHDEYRNLGVNRRRLNPRIWCYARTDDPSIVGGSIINDWLEAFDQMFGMKSATNFSTGGNTLGDLVYFCRLEGRVFKDPGDIDNQALLIVPLVVEMP